MPVDLAAVVRNEVDAFGADLVARGLERTINVQLPTAPWPLPTVLGDADLLAVAVRNLLVNAAKYSDQGARIEVRGAEDAGIVVFEVADAGWGIAAENLPQVWDELWRSSDARKVEEAASVSRSFALSRNSMAAAFRSGRSPVLEQACGCSCPRSQPLDD